MRLWLLTCLPLFFFLIKPVFADSATNICRVFSKHPHWQKIANKTQQKWGVPVVVQMAIMEQESDFKADAKNPKSTAKGFAQAENNIWSDFRDNVNKKAVRTNFASSSHFIGWYADSLKKQDHISPKNAYNLYLAYHDGSGGYKQDLHEKHVATRKLALRVQDVADLYKKELSSC